jgi:hypothetical protein
MTNQTDRAVSKQLQTLAKRISRDLQKVSGRDDIGFALVVFQTTDDSRCSYISNCERKAVADALKALLEHWSQGMPDVPAHEIN